MLHGQFSVLAEKLDTITDNIREQRAEARSNRTAILSTVVGVGVALAALLWAAITYGDSVFSHGMSVRDVVEVAVRDAMKQIPAK